MVLPSKHLISAKDIFGVATYNDDFTSRYQRGLVPQPWLPFVDRGYILQLRPRDIWHIQHPAIVQDSVHLVETPVQYSSLRSDERETVPRTATRFGTLEVAIQVSTPGHGVQVEAVQVGHPPAPEPPAEQVQARSRTIGSVCRSRFGATAARLGPRPGVLLRAVADQLVAPASFVEGTRRRVYDMLEGWVVAGRWAEAAEKVQPAIVLPADELVAGRRLRFATRVQLLPGQGREVQPVQTVRVVVAVVGGVGRVTCEPSETSKYVQMLLQ